jgi:bla regulator protein blaR1
VTGKLILAAGWMAIAVFSQETPVAAPWQIAAGGKMAFEVASVKPSNPDKFTPPSFPLDAGDAFTPTGGRFSADFPLVVYISFAYKLQLTPGQMQAMTAHLPKWVASDRFSIQAKAEGNATKDQMRLMMQSLLAERFRLEVHFETQNIPLLAATLVKAGKTGPKLRPHGEGLACDAAPSADVFPNRCDVYAMMMLPGRANKLGSRNTTMEYLAGGLSGAGRLTRPVVDQTGLSGRWDFTIEWTPEPTGPPPDGSAPPESQAPTFLEAVREQLGLKLESTNGPIHVLVVDRVERPSEN